MQIATKKYYLSSFFICCSNSKNLIHIVSWCCISCSWSAWRWVSQKKLKICTFYLGHTKNYGAIEATPQLLMAVLKITFLGWLTATRMIGVASPVLNYITTLHISKVRDLLMLCWCTADVNEYRRGYYSSQKWPT